MSTDVPQSPSSRSSRRIIFALALIVTAISLAYWSWSNRQDLAAESVAGVLAKLDREGVRGEMRVREVREGRAEVVQMWGRPESVREEFRQRRAL